jgi:aryl-alcohol dehydrogenase-like predicted oxidoreductase
MNPILGSANFGAAYGIAQQGSQLQESEVYSILESARNLGVKTIDTAPVYGRSDEIIGRYHMNVEPFKVHSKIPRIYGLSAKKVLEAIDASMRMLRVRNFEILYFHNSETLFQEPRGIINGVIKAVLDSGIATEIGVSVYTEDEIFKVTQNFPNIKTFQVPESILDQRLINSRLISTLKEDGCKFYVRSIFLQGLTLLPQEKVPAKFREIQTQLNAFSDFAAQQDLSKLQASLSYLRHLSWANGFIIGVNSRKQLEEVVTEYQNTSPLSSLPMPLPNLYSDPRNWTTLTS